MKRPLVSVVSYYVIGLLLAEFCQLPLGALFPAAFIILALALVLKKFRSWLVWPLVVLAGWTNLVSRTAVISPADVRLVVGGATELVTVRGTLTETPQLRMFERDEQELWRTLALVHISEISRGNQWQQASGQIIVTTPGTLTGSFCAGQPVEITGVLSPPRSPIAEGLFDYRAYLRRQGIYYQLKADSTNDWALLSPVKSPPLSEWFIGWATKTMSSGLPNDQTTQLMLAMTLGQKTALTDEVSEPFMQSGTIHIFLFSTTRYKARKSPDLCGHLGCAKSTHFNLFTLPGKILRTTLG